MRTLLIMGVVSFLALAASAQESMQEDSVLIEDVTADRTDTIYYNKNWRATHNKAFANYYRYALYPANEAEAHEFKTYYATGELEGEGIFVSLDKTDDKKSVFDGEVLNYYKNGLLAEKRFFKNGILDGEHTTYYENGNIKGHETLLLGKRVGIVSSFTEDGKVCRLTPYSEGTPLGYYAVVDFLGNYSKYDSTNDELILEAPQLSEMATEYKNGVPWHYYNKNGLIVGVSNSMQKELGGYREIGVFIVNKSMVNVEIDPAKMEVYSMKNGKRANTFKLVDADTYDKKILKQKKQLAKRDKHKKKVMVVYEHENNVNANLGAREFDVGNSQTLKIFQERIISLKEMTGENRMRYAERLPEDLGYLERTTIHPGEIVTGYLYTSERYVNDLFVTVNISGIDYTFEWKSGKK